jgi:ComF family protein
MRNLIWHFIDILYPKHCHLCHNRLKSNDLDDVVCLDCWSGIKKNLPPFCRRCGRNIKDNRITKHICAGCRRTNFGFDRAFSPCVYEGTIKELIYQFKYGSRDYLGKTLSRLLIDFIKEYGLEVSLFDLIIPVPLHQRKLREREFNQAQTLSEFLSAGLGLELSTKELIRVRDTATQTGLDDRQRWSNLSGSFAVGNTGKVKGKNILLIDDVFTTGATCSEAAAALKSAGAGAVFVLTLAN